MYAQVISSSKWSWYLKPVNVFNLEAYPYIAMLLISRHTQRCCCSQKTGSCSDGQLKELAWLAGWLTVHQLTAHRTSRTRPGLAASSHQRTGEGGWEDQWVNTNQELGGHVRMPVPEQLQGVWASDHHHAECVLRVTSYLK